MNRRRKRTGTITEDNLTIRKIKGLPEVSKSKKRGGGGMEKKKKRGKRKGGKRREGF